MAYDDVSKAPTTRVVTDSHELVSTPSRNPLLQPSWRKGTLGCAVAALVVFFINFAVTIGSVVNDGYTKNQGQHALYEGDCDTAAKINIASHVLINALSTILLSASSYCMQCVSAPTRAELDTAHAQKRWLDIGALSIRNLRRIERRRVVIWVLLGLSSVPLHLFYNSTVYASISNHKYTPVFVSQSFADRTNTTMDEIQISALDDHRDEAEVRRLRALQLEGKLERLDTLQCIDAYARDYQPRGSLFIVLPDEGLIGSYYHGPSCYSGARGNEWMCPYNQTDNVKLGDFSSNCHLRKEIADARADTSLWRPFKVHAPNATVAYCLSEIRDEPCKVQSSLHIASIVVLLNLLKAGIMLYVGVAIKIDPILTIGDAIASYTAFPDRATYGMCLASRISIAHQDQELGEWTRDTNVFREKRARFFKSASVRRWVICLSLYLGTLGVIGWLLSMAVVSITDYRGNFSTMLQLGIGRLTVLNELDIDIQTEGVSGLISNILVANSAQLVLTLIYLTYNGLMTAICSSLEWNGFSRTRKGLRLSSSPQGSQRSSYFLQLPYRFAIPLMTLSGLLHWLVSQSIFVGTWDTYYVEPGRSRWELASTSYHTGYSPAGIMAILALGLIMIIILLAMGWRKMENGMPVVASCSAAIAAACHVPNREDRLETSLAKVQWGAICGTDSADGLGHCTFSQADVRMPLEGEKYM